MGFIKTELIAKKLDFDKFSSIGKTTAIEYAKIYKMLLNKEILNSNLCDEIIKILSHQTKNEMLTRFLPPKYLEQKNTLDGFIKFIASKSGGLSDRGEKNIVNCRNDGGIISTKYGNYIISIFINNFSDRYFYNENPASLLGAKICKEIFDAFKKNNGKLV